MSFNDNLPPGVSASDPHLTGELPCDECGGLGYDEDEDGKHACPVCEGKGYITGEESYYDHQYACSDCGGLVELDDQDTFSCEDCRATYTVSQIAYGDLDKYVRSSR